MMDQQNLVSSPDGGVDPGVALAKALGQWPKPEPARRRVLRRKVASPTAPPVEVLAKDLGLTLGEQRQLTIRRIKRGNLILL